MIGSIGSIGSMGGLGLSPSRGGGFNFADWRAQQLNGIWLDYTDPDWLRQEPNGPTAVAATNDVIGLAMSRRLIGQQGTLAAYLAGRPELVANGDFSNGLTGWTTVSGTVAVVAGAARLTADGTSEGRILQSFATVIGRTYRCSGRILAGGTVNGRVVVNSTNSTTSPLGAQALASGDIEILFTATSTTTWVILANTAVTNGVFADYDALSVKEVSRNAATQATVNGRPKFDGLNGAIHDALDDNLLSNYTAKAGVNMLLMRIAVPASPSGYQMPAGLQAASSGRFRLAISNGSGRLECAVGNDTTLFGDSVDVRGQTTNVAVACDGATVRMFRGDAQVLEVAQNGAVNTAVPLRFGAQNGNGTASSFWGGRIFKAGAFHLSAMPDEALWRQISASL